MKKINIYDFYKSEKELVIKCDTFQQACILCDQFNKDGKKWACGFSYLEYVRFEKSPTYYSNKGFYFTYPHNYFTIYSFEEVDFSVKKTNKKFLLDCIDRKYFNNFLRPFRDNIQYITKIPSLSFTHEYIKIWYVKDFNPDYICLPNFKTDTMFKKLELDKQYDLNDLDLFKDKLITKEEFLSNKDYFLCCQNERDYKKIVKLLNMYSKDFKKANNNSFIKEENEKFAKKHNYQLAINPRMMIMLKSAVKDEDISIFDVDEIEW